MLNGVVEERVFCRILTNEKQLYQYMPRVDLQEEAHSIIIPRNKSVSVK